MAMCLLEYPVELWEVAWACEFTATVGLRINFQIAPDKQIFGHNECNDLVTMVTGPMSRVKSPSEERRVEKEG